MPLNLTDDQSDPSNTDAPVDDAPHEASTRRWGADIIAGGARFSLWAPAAREVALRAGTTREIAMRSERDGWWRLETDAVPVEGGYAFKIDDEHVVPDPAAREQVCDVHRASRLVDPAAYTWRCDDWRGRPWEEAVVYEMHVGTFTEQGDFAAAAAKLPHLVDLGVTAVEIMPVAQFAGRRGWGYDGVLIYAPHQAYGGVKGLKSFVDAAHEHGLMVLLDVVYNHFGPEGNYLHAYAPQFFDPKRETPWGAAIDYDRPEVRGFFAQNAAYWISEYRMDGLRLDAIDQIRAPGHAPVMEEIAKAAREAAPGREIHLTTEDDRNITRLHERDANGRPKLYTAEWNDDFHHVAHVAATGEQEGYYTDYTGSMAERMVRILTTGFDYQGAWSEHRKENRGVPSDHLPPTAFVDFVQNHDQVGNRAMGDRIGSLTSPRAVEALTSINLLSPHIPMLFMGEEWDERRPFLFFADYEGDLADAVRRGRRAEFRYWSAFEDPASRDSIPDPIDPATFEASRIDWGRATGEGADRLEFIRSLLKLRRAEIAPRLAGLRDGSAVGETLGGGAFAVRWRFADADLHLAANIADTAEDVPAGPGRILWESDDGVAAATRDEGAPLPGWTTVWTLETR